MRYTNESYGTSTSDTLNHHGIKGMRWGVRRFQNKDGSLTPAGEKRAAKLAAKETRERLKDKQVARRITIEKAKQQMKEDAKDRSTMRKNAERESKARAAAEKTKAKQDEQEELYDLPDDSEASRQRASAGRKLLVGAVAVVGAIVAGYAIKKIHDKYSSNKDGGDSKKVEDAVKEAAEKLSNTSTNPAKTAAKTAAKEAKAAAKQAKAAAKAAAKATTQPKTRWGKQKMYNDMFKNSKQDVGTVLTPGMKEQQAQLKERLLKKYGSRTPSSMGSAVETGRSIIGGIISGNLSGK